MVSSQLTRVFVILLVEAVLLSVALSQSITKHSPSYRPGKGPGDWDYVGNFGPHNWKNVPGFEQCGFWRQSPVNLANPVPTAYSPIQFTGYNNIPSGVKLSNNGHDAEVEYEYSTTPRMSGGGLNGTFLLHDTHFHWGSDSSKGSEHTFNGRRFPMEMHVVHWNDKYADINEAKHSNDRHAIAVVGFLFRLSAVDNPNFAPIIRGLAHVRNSLTSLQLGEVFSVGSLFGRTDNFFRYDGSLTTPECNQVVSWTVMKDKIPISERQLSAFRQLIEHHGHSMVDNFRPLQPLNGRYLTCNKLSLGPQYGGGYGGEGWNYGAQWRRRINNNEEWIRKINHEEARRLVIRPDWRRRINGGEQGTGINQGVPLETGYGINGPNNANIIITITGGDGSNESDDGLNESK